MSLIPYGEGREVVLRHRNALVVRNSSSQQLEIRSTDICPACHRPLSHQSSSHDFESSRDHDTFIDPNYFRMLRDNHASYSPHPSGSPTRRLTRNFLPSNGARLSASSDDGLDSSAFSSEADSSTYEEQPHGSRIRRDAFSQNYFRTFFKEEKELGRGGKGVVLLVRHEIDGCSLGHFACKRVPVGDDHGWLEKVLIEVELLAKLQHPNLVSYRHVWLEDVKVNNFGPPVACAFILQQYCNSGDLLKYVVGDAPKLSTKEQLKSQARRRSRGQIDSTPPALSKRLLSYEEIFALFRDITAGLAYLHEARYIHRDLKPNNCLLHKYGNSVTCLISDFGEVQQENMDRKSTGATGTVSYCAPEVLKQDFITGKFGNFTYKSDMFSLGMILYFMCFGRLPYRSANAVQEELEDIDELRDEISRWKGFQDEKRERPDLPAKLYHLLRKLLSLNPTERPSAIEVLAAMRSESNFDGIPRVPRPSSPIGVPGRRIQNLDSPLPPSTPIPEPSKHFKPSRLGREGDMATQNPAAGPSSPSSLPTPQNTLQKISLSSTPRLRAQAMAVTRSHDGMTQSPSRRRRTTSESPSRQHFSPHVTTPLLMAPPTTFAEGVHHRALVNIHNFLGEYGGSLSIAVRLVVFSVKIFTLMSPCFPYTPQTMIGTLLISLAALDLAMPYPTANRPYNGRPNIPSPSRFALSTFPRSAIRSIALLICHFLILWLTSYFSNLCPVSKFVWMGAKFG